MTPSKQGACVSLTPKVNRSLVPNKDFVLYIRDEGISKPSAISTLTASGQQAINIKVLTDSRSEHVKSRVMQDIMECSGISGTHELDMAADVKYSRTELEQLAHEQDMADRDEAAQDNDDEEQKEGECQEYIFLIDRSGSMYNTINLAREALQLFLYSLPAQSKFNVCSYGSRFKFMFPERSVDYNDQNLQTAIDQISTFNADFGGTQIYEPLAEIFR